MEKDNQENLKVDVDRIMERVRSRIEEKKQNRRVIPRRIWKKLNG